jgi:uncharacterized protein
MGAAAIPLRAEADPQGRLADNIVYFSRALRHSGIKLGPASVTDAVDAVLAGGLGGRDDFYWTLHCVLIKRREDRQVFDETFRLFWKSRELVEKMIAMFSPVAPETRERQRKRAGESRAEGALFSGHDARKQPDEAPQVEVDARFTVSEREILRTKDFAQMNAAELTQAKRAIAGMILPFDEVRTRRRMPDPRGRRIDPRATMQAAMRNGGLLLPRFSAPRLVHPPLVVIADISGSMSQYSRLFLHFMHAVMEKRRRVHAFVFGTRLTNLTRALKRRDPDEALDLSAAQVRDWSGGTRIGDTLAEFNRIWSRRVLSQGAVVILISDGLERDDTTALGVQAERLHKSCRRLIWLNPLLRFDGFEARAKGVRALLPHVDEFRPSHSLDALQDLCNALSATRPARQHDPGLWLRAIR